mmetsp:Transcript_21027/g.66422  ORF Transcript_21027/g.66422 Transcript_21027/m.66422 type:complete len:340 (+) Transcript_21027:808-1827(+)
MSMTWVMGCGDKERPMDQPLSGGREPGRRWSQAKPWLAPPMPRATTGQAGGVCAAASCRLLQPPGGAAECNSDAWQVCAVPDTARAAGAARLAGPGGALGVRTLEPRAAVATDGLKTQEEGVAAPVMLTATAAGAQKLEPCGAITTAGFNTRGWSWLWVVCALEAAGTLADAPSEGQATLSTGTSSGALTGAEAVPEGCNGAGSMCIVSTELAEAVSGAASGTDKPLAAAGRVPCADVDAAAGARAGMDTTASWAPLCAEASADETFTGVISGAPSFIPSAYMPSAGIPLFLRCRGVTVAFDFEPLILKFLRDCSTSASIIASCSEVRSLRWGPISWAS